MNYSYSQFINDSPMWLLFVVILIAGAYLKYGKPTNKTKHS